MRKLSDEELAALKEQYANTSSERERAKLEDYVWRNSGIPVQMARPTVAEVFGVSQYELTMKHGVFLGGDSAAPLWDRIERGMSYGTAHRIWQNIRQNHSKSIRRAKLIEFLERYEGGEIDRAHEPRQQTSVRPAPPELLPEALGVKDFRKQVHNIATAYYGAKLAEIPDEERERLAREFEQDLDALMTSHQNRIRRAEEFEERRHTIGRTELRNACRILHIDPPRKRESLDEFLGKARRQQRELARLYHPDTNRGSNENRPRYEAVISAFGVVESYIEQQKKIEKTTPPNDAAPLRVVRGGKR